MGWLLVSPAGTLNGTAPSALGYPSGLSMIALSEAAGALVLDVSRGAAVRSASIAAGDCALSIAESGDYRFEFRTGSGEHFARTITVNRDLGED
jgi:hypothetical protein